MKQSIALVLVGMAIGCAAALALARYVQSLLFGMKPADPVTIAIALASLFLVTALAAWIPAPRDRRRSRPGIEIRVRNGGRQEPSQ